MSKYTLKELKKVYPNGNYNRIERLTEEHNDLLDDIKYDKAKLTVLMNSKLVNASCMHDWLVNLSDKSDELYNVICEIKFVKKELKSKTRRLKMIRQEIKNTIGGIIRESRIDDYQEPMKIKPKQIEVIKAGVFTVNYKSAMELISKLTKMVSDNMADWKENPGRRLVVEFKSV